MIFYVYEHWRLDTDTCFYVGKGRGSRAYQRNSRNVHWRNIVNKLESMGSGYEIRLVATGLTEEEAFKLEIERIAFWREIVDLANKTIGGEGFSGGRHTLASKQKISAASKKYVSENKHLMSERMKGGKNPFYGKTHSEETRQIISKKLKGKCFFIHKPLTDEQKHAISSKLKAKGIRPPSRKGSSTSEETRKKQSEALTAFWAAKKQEIKS